jgi:hypothetical protein
MFCVALTAVAASAPAAAFTQSSFVQFTLEGCRNDGSIVLPIGGVFVCPDAAYTTGNLGKGWNELDLVPHRLTTSAGTQATATTDYQVIVAADNKLGTKIGYDVLTAPVVNTAKSHASCSVSAGPQSIASGVTGGVDDVIYRVLTIHQNKGTTCVFDYVERLALGASQYSGSSLQSYMFEKDDFSTGKRTVSIPVKEILPQGLRKTMTATADSTVQWNLLKSADPASINFGNVCKATDDDLKKQVTFRVEWVKVGTTPGGVTYITNIYAKNPASRVITVNVTDVVYKGLTQTTVVGTASTAAAGVDVPANTELLVLTHTKTITDGSAGALGDSLNDVATATYTDKATGITVPGNTTATASAQIGAGVTTDSFAAIADTESMTGTGLTFSVVAPSIGAFQGSPAYVAGTKTVGPVDWAITGETAGRYVDFVKTIYLDGRRVTTGKIEDTAVLVANNSAPTLPLSPPYLATAYASAAITSSASVELTITKTIPPLQLGANERIEVTFRVTRSDDPTYQVDKTLTFVNGDTSKSAPTMTGLVPDTYTVTELSSQLCNGATCGPSNLVVDGSNQQSKTLTAGTDGIFQASECAATASFTNIPAAGAAVAQVQKITTPAIADDQSDPNYADLEWTFTLAGPGGPKVKVVKAGAGYGEFELVLQEGSYTVTETQRTPSWVLTSATPEGATADKICEFSVNYPQDYGATFSCTFTNVKQGRARVEKTARGSTLVGTTLAFTFELRSGASTTSDGTTIETQVANAANGGNFTFAAYLTPGASYQVCEQVMPGWNTNLAGPLFVPNSVIPPSLPNPNVNNMTVCTNFTAVAGQTTTFVVDNSPPPGGLARTIGFWKNWASCASSKGGQRPVLDQTMALAETLGIIVSADTGAFPAFGPDISLVLHGSTVTPNVAPDCLKAVRLLDKSTINTGKKMASDPAFNLAAQLLAAELNQYAGAGTNAAVLGRISDAVRLLGAVNFNGITHGNISAAQATAMNNLAKLLDDYNNNR